MKLSLQEIINCLENTDQSTSWYYDADNDRFVTSGDGDYVALPDQRGIDAYGMMVSFISTVRDEEAKRWLRNAVRGRGAFRMFRATCERFDLLRDWYDYREEAYRNTAIDWCLENGFAYEDMPYAEDDDDDPVYDDEYEEIPEEKKEIRYGAVSRRNSLPVVLLVRDDLQEEGTEADAEDAAEVLGMYFREGCAVYAAMENGIPVGYIASADDRITRLYVRPQYRRRGIGSALLKTAENAETVIDLPPGRPEAQAFFNRRGYGRIEMIRLGRNDETAETE